MLIALASPAFCQPAAVFTRYCVTCHNATLKTAGFVLNPDMTQVTANAETWEKVIRKLRTNAMPPGLARPGPIRPPTMQRRRSSKPSSTAPPPRSRSPASPLLHRLNRTEYQNAIRDSSRSTRFPKRWTTRCCFRPIIPAAALDNLADLLFVSPTTMERYLDAARKISRLVVGDPSMPLMVNSYRLSPEQTQDIRVDELPFGTRGGLAVRTDLPLDGEYAVKFELAGAAREAHQIEVSVDGERVGLVPIGSAGGAKPMEVRVPLKAGARPVSGVAFVQRTEARDDRTVRPRLRAGYIAFLTVTISSPYYRQRSGKHTGASTHFCLPAPPAHLHELLRGASSVDIGKPGIPQAGDGDSPIHACSGSAEQNQFDMAFRKAAERLLVPCSSSHRARDPPNIAWHAHVPATESSLAPSALFASSIPDEWNQQTAEQGSWVEPAVLEQQVRRMLGRADPRSNRWYQFSPRSGLLFLRDVSPKNPMWFCSLTDDGLCATASSARPELFLDRTQPIAALDLLTV